jgi:uridine kinase
VSLETEAGRIVDAIAAWQHEQPDTLVVAIDGHGAAGKSAIAEAVADALAATLIHVDDFFHEATSGDGQPMSQYYDWARLRRETLEPALAGAVASAVIIVEGVSASTPALADLVTRTILVQTPEPERLERLHGRITPAEWDEAWLAAERVYLATRPADSFDLVVSGSAARSGEVFPRRRT